jgi:hypothetical protein
MNERRYARGILLAAMFGLVPAACATAPERVPSSGPTEGAGGNKADDPADSSTTTSTGSGEVAKPTCEDPPTELDLEALGLEGCPASICGGGAHCVPEAMVLANGGPEQAAMLAPCDEPDSLCVPDEFIETQGFFTPKTCESVLGAEGRCMSTCIPQVSEQLKQASLPQDVCNDHEVCAPCYDPQTGDSSGACDQSCDEGPTEEPVLLPECCGGLGKCVPTEAVPGDKLESLGEYECAEEAGEGFVCAPKVFVEDLNFKPKPCSKIGFLAKLTLPPQYQEGRCLPDCLPQLDKAPVSQGDCEENFLCTPCYQPKFFGGVEPTGACDF